LAEIRHSGGVEAHNIKGAFDAKSVVALGHLRLICFSAIISNQRMDLRVLEFFVVL
jgi:hypothetical protein